MVITASQRVRQAGTGLDLQPIEAHSMRALTMRSSLPQHKFWDFEEGKARRAGE